MLDLLSGPINKCDAVSRRSFLQIGALGGLGISLPMALAQKQAAITKAQNRIRANMRSVNRNSKLFGRYVKKLNDQEDQMEGLLGRLENAQSELDAARAKLSKFIRAVRF